MEGINLTDLGLSLEMPDDFQKMRSLPDDPPRSVAYYRDGEGYRCILMLYPIPLEHTMPFDAPAAVVAGIHRSIDDEQGLVEVDSGSTSKGKMFIYSIVKSKMEPSGIQYCLTMHLRGTKACLNITGFFDEIGVTGDRETAVMEALMRSGKTREDVLIDWAKDPYDPQFSRGLLANASELKDFDSYFPQHPLSVARDFIRFLIAMN